MNSAEQHPPSTFYADINSPSFPDGYFDFYFPAIERYAQEHPQNVRTAAQEDPEQLRRRIVQSGQLNRVDYLIHYVSPAGSTFEVVNNDKGIADVLASQNRLDPEHPTILKAAGLEAEKLVATFLQSGAHLYAYLLNTAGVCLSEPSRATMWDYLNPGLGPGDAAWNLLGAKMAMVSVAELVFDDSGKPKAARKNDSGVLHQQMGVITTEGFLPFFTRLSDSHPTMQAYNKQLYTEVIEQQEQARQQQQAQQQKQAVPQRTSSFLARVKAVAKQALLRYNK